MGKIKRLINNIFSDGNSGFSRSNFLSSLGKTFEGKRDLYNVLGYSRILQFQDYYNKFERQDIASRIITAYPQAIWNKRPIVQEDEDKETQTQFESEFENLCKEFNLYHFFNRVDILSCIGRYAVLLLVFEGDTNLDTQVVGTSNRLAYIAPYSEGSTTIAKFDADPLSPRFGLPEIYRIQIGGYIETGQIGSKSMDVHHSRILHVAQDTLENNVYGTPILKKIFNRLDDLEKILGGSSEIYWLNARGALHVNAPENSNIKNPEKLKEQINEYVHQLRRVIRTEGMEITPLQLGIHDPSRHVETILNVITAATAIPKRELIGASERAEVSSNQDENNFTKRINERRLNYCEPKILRAFIHRMMEYGVLPTVENYNVVWEDLNTLSEKDKADINLKKMQTIVAYVNSNGADLIVPPAQLMEEFIERDYREDDIRREFESESLDMEENANSELN